MKLKCELCSEYIGEVDEKTLRLPLVSEMFGSPDPAHGLPAPFNPGLSWEYFHCPCGPHNPIILPDRILTDEGYVKVGEQGATKLDDGLDPAQREIRDRGEAEKAAELLARRNLGLIPDPEPEPEPEPQEQPKPEPKKQACFECPHCDKVFREQRFLNSHIGKKHPEAGNATK